MEFTLRTPDQGETTVGIGDLPDRKRKALYRIRGGAIVPLAYFLDEDCGEFMERFLGDIAGVFESTRPTQGRN